MATVVATASHDVPVAANAALTRANASADRVVAQEGETPSREAYGTVGIESEVGTTLARVSVRGAGTLVGGRRRGNDGKESEKNEDLAHHLDIPRGFS